MQIIDRVRPALQAAVSAGFIPDKHLILVWDAVGVVVRLKAGVIGGVASGGVADGGAAVDQHRVGHFVARGIIPAHKCVARSRGGGGADGHSHSVGVGIASQSSDLIVRSILPGIAVFDLADVGLGDAAGEAGVIGIDAFLSLRIAVSGVCSDEITVCVIPALKGEAVLCGGCGGNRFIRLGVVGFADGFIGSVIIRIGIVRHAGDLHGTTGVGIRIGIATAHLRDKRLPPAPLGYHSQALVDIGVIYCCAIYRRPGHTLDLVVILNKRFTRCHAFAINFEILCLRISVHAIKSVITGHRMYVRENQAAQLTRVYLYIP